MYNAETAKNLVEFAVAIKEERPYDFISNNINDLTTDALKEIIFTLMDAIDDDEIDEIADTLIYDNAGVYYM